MTPGMIHGFDTVVSTQNIARDMALAGEPSGTVVFAEFQTGGRGRQGKAWFAPPGANVCMTIIGDAVASGEAWKVALIAGIAAAEAIAEAEPDAGRVSLRFPNDLQWNGRKLGGILVESVPHPTLSGFVIPLIGVGVNGNVLAFPDDLLTRAVSLRLATGHACEVGALAGLILRRLCDLWDMPFAGDLLSRWRGLHDREAVRDFQINNQTICCRVLEIDTEGTVTLEPYPAQGGQRYQIHAAHVILGDD